MRTHAPAVGEPPRVELTDGGALPDEYGICAEKHGQAERPISTGQLNTLPCVHLPPINLVVYEGPSGRPHLGGGFPLRCFQRLSLPHMATERCRWRDNSYTRGASIPVLSY